MASSHITRLRLEAGEQVWPAAHPCLRRRRLEHLLEVKRVEGHGRVAASSIDAELGADHELSRMVTPRGARGEVLAIEIVTRRVIGAPAQEHRLPPGAEPGQ
jgi:hypothetical protein